MLSDFFSRKLLAMFSIVGKSLSMLSIVKKKSLTMLSLLKKKIISNAFYSKIVSNVFTLYIYFTPTLLVMHALTLTIFFSDFQCTTQ